VHHEPPDETCGAADDDVGAEVGDLSFEVPDELVFPDELEVPDDDAPEPDVAWCPDDVEVLACVDVIPGSATAIPAVASTLAVVAEMATALTRARPRLLAAISPRGS
jgi:hypothetical protein